jgi:branched-chain amino acid transport system permease protein
MTAGTGAGAVRLMPRRWIAALFIVLALVPIAARFGAEGYILSLLTRALIFAIAALSLDLIVGYGALISFGHAAFIGIGSYAVGMLASHGIHNILVQLFAALIAAAAFAVVTGAISLRTTGVYYIMSTLAFGQMLFFFAVSLSAYGGDDGMSLSGRSRLFGADVLKSDRVFYYLVLALLIAVYLLLCRVIASRFGRILRGTRENPERMQAIGVSPFRYQLVACVLAGLICALAGLLLANQTGFVSPAYMSWQRSGELLIMVILGGIGTLHGAILGALAFLLIEEWLSGLTEHWKMIFGPLLVLVVLFGRGGISGALARLGGRTDG